MCTSSSMDRYNGICVRKEWTATIHNKLTCFQKLVLNLRIKNKRYNKIVLDPGVVLSLVGSKWLGVKENIYLPGCNHYEWLETHKSGAFWLVYLFYAYSNALKCGYALCFPKSFNSFFSCFYFSKTFY